MAEEGLDLGAAFTASGSLRASWPERSPVGRHHSVVHQFPAILEMLSGRVPATFYLEAWNFDIYPDAVRAIAGAGHGWEPKSVERGGRFLVASRSCEITAVRSA
ncbi:hypothetical protein [Nonomuraea sp. 10N515B]|uniref:hypothetical protein n=1 Tax=Nonomuraea sp. 10N515B TaxID=3457422 RepID=UPI003FCCE735